MEFLRNPSTAEIKALIQRSKHKAARRIQDPRNGDFWYWDAADGTHAEGAQKLGVPYDRPPGAGDIVTL
jgi:hypothetical protein